jgi:hypothetical protein
MKSLINKILTKLDQKWGAVQFSQDSDITIRLMIGGQVRTELSIK